MNPMRLADAAKHCFPMGGVTKHTLLAAIRDGALGYIQIGKAYYVTEADIQDWLNKCRARKRESVSGSVSAKAAKPSMSSLTERMKSAQASALKMSKVLTKPLPTISPSTSGQTQQSGGLITFPSPRS